jgi:hypothetical protein
MSAAPARARGGFSPTVMIAMVLVGVFSFAAFITLSAFAPELSSGRDGRAHALSNSAVGFAGAVRLARATFGDVVSVGRRVNDPTRYDGLVVLSPEHGFSPEALGPAMGASTLIVLPKWAVMPDLLHRGWVLRAGAYDPAQVSAMVGDFAPGAVVAQAEGVVTPRLTDYYSQGVATGPIQSLQTISGAGLTPIVVDQEGRPIVVRVDAYEDQDVYILADPDFLNTQGVANLATARAGMSILQRVHTRGQPIVFDVTMNGLGSSRSMLRLAFEPPFLGATLAIAVAAGLLGWRAASRAGPAAPRRRAIALGKAALADNSAALLRLTGRARKLGPGYARLIGAQLAEELSGARKDEAEAAAWLDRVAAANGVEGRFSELARQAEAAKSSIQVLEAAQKLHAWKQEMERATR